MKNNLLVSLILLVSGLAFAGVAGFLYTREARLEREGLQAQRTVIALAEKTDSEGSKTYAPVVRFRTQSGRVFEFQSGASSSPPQYETGQNVTVLYPRDNPSEAVIQGENTLLVTIFGAIGLFELAGSLFFFFRQVIPAAQGE
jgi:hypothetical protein